MNKKSTIFIILFFVAAITSYAQKITKQLSTSTDTTVNKNDEINLGFMQVKRTDVITNVTQIKPSDFLEYDGTQNITDAIMGRVAGMTSSNNVRGLGNALLVIDGNPSSLTLSQSSLSNEEIESITVLKDASAVVLYGTQARNGVILIRTKHGSALKKQFNINVSTDIRAPKALPQYLGSADYMTLYNEARANDGLTPLYDSTTIVNYRNGNKYRYPDVDYYSKDYIKQFAKSTRIMGDFSGGNKKSSYYANLEWINTGNFINFGDVANMSNNRIKARTNIDFSITDFIRNSVSASTVMDFNKSSVTDYLSSASTARPNIYSPLLPIDLMNQAFPDVRNYLDARKNDYNGQYLFGGNSQNTSNPFADVLIGGYNQTIKQILQFNNRIDVDLNKVTNGLSMVGNIGFDFSNQYNQSISNKYSVYEPIWSPNKDSIIGFNKYGNDTRDGVLNLSNPNFYRRFSAFLQLNYERTFQEHSFNGTILASADKFDQYNTKSGGELQPEKNANLGMRLAYNYKHTYYVDFSSAYVNSIKLAKGQRGGFSPTLAIAWTLSNEKFLADVEWINFFKLKLSSGIIKSDLSIAGFNYWDNPYQNGASYNWNENNSTNLIRSSMFGANPNLTFEKRKEFNFGFETTLFNNSLNFTANYFNTIISDKVTRLSNSYPNYYADYTPYVNNDIDAYYGVELGANFSKQIGDFKISLGGTGMYRATNAVKRDEYWQDSYSYRQGKPLDATFALESLGLFKDEDDIKNSPYQTFGDVKPGDIKYKDQNNDGLINSNDQIQVGNSQFSWVFGLDFNIKYKGFSFSAFGEGALGADTQLSGSYYRMNSADKYSIIALERWTVSTKETARYPRLTTLAGTNNDQSSTFWLYDNSYFNLSRIQFTYDIPEKIATLFAMNKLSLYLRGSGLFVISEKTDVRNLTIGSDPQCRIFTLGVRSNF